jgi:NAD(P)-dependent dehydrogenase (short-subunit alcohol dehydrogenase family)
MDESKPQALALVTGGARRVGRIFCVQLARMGYQVAIHFAHATDEANQTRDIIHAMGGQASLLQADLTDIDAIQAMFSEIQNMPVRLEILVNNAAIMPSSDLLSLSESDWTDAMNLNLRAPLFCSRIATPLMKDHGLIINVSDYFANQTWTKRPLYGLTKSSLDHLTRLLAKRLHPGIRVNGLALAPVLPPDEMNPREWQRVIERSPGEKAVSGEQIKQAMEYLIENDGITGQIIPVTAIGFQTILQ